MGEEAWRTRAFKRASLKSEAYRVVGLLCVLAGAAVFVLVRGVVTKQYLLLAAQLVARFPFPVYGLYAVLIFTASIVAAAIARQFRSYVSAALREARLQSELEQINHELDIARSIQQGPLPLSPPKLDFSRGTTQNDDLTAVVLKRKSTVTARKEETMQAAVLAMT